MTASQSFAVRCLKKTGGHNIFWILLVGPICQGLPYPGHKLGAMVKQNVLWDVFQDATIMEHKLEEGFSQLKGRGKRCCIYIAEYICSWLMSTRCRALSNQCFHSFKATLMVSSSWFPISQFHSASVSFWENKEQGCRPLSSCGQLCLFHTDSRWSDIKAEERDPQHAVTQSVPHQRREQHSVWPFWNNPGYHQCTQRQSSGQKNCHIPPTLNGKICYRLASLVQTGGWSPLDCPWSEWSKTF